MDNSVSAGGFAHSFILPRSRGTDLAAALSAHGLILRGGFHPAAEEEGFEGARTALLVGNAGRAMWEAFAPHIDGAPNPLDRWTKRVVDAVAGEFGARAVYPFDRPHRPFQRWAMRAEPVHPSPLGILIHPQYGLWHAYRAALLFAERLELPPRPEVPSPCASCAAKPCLAACPVGAFTGDAYDVPACAAHIATPEADCLAVGCHARNACPVGADWRYRQAETRFHMAAFGRSVSAG
jgi:ferredoxin